MAKRRAQRKRISRKKGKKGGTRRRVGSSRSRRARSNPRGVVIGDSAISLSYEGGQGKRKGKMRGPWRHPFESDDVQIVGKKGGRVVELRSKSGKKLWDFFEV